MQARISVAVLRLVSALLVGFPLLAAWLLFDHSSGVLWVGGVVAAMATFAMVMLNRPADVVEPKDDALVLGLPFGQRVLPLGQIAYVLRSRPRDWDMPLVVYVGTTRGSGLFRHRYIAVSDADRALVDWAADRGVRVMNDSVPRRTSAST